ncbi:hypothetical protein J6590_066628 [Homalodisca vitripennis]|nr:hypothetical protein J6590_066628 [Homalodisca vitripennis]
MEYCTSVDGVARGQCSRPTTAGEGELNIDGFDLVLTDKTRNQNGGVVILVNKRLPVTATQTTLGDTCLHVMTTLQKDTQRLNGYGLVQCVDKPTRVTEHSMTCIDHIFVSYDDMSRTTVTDHYSTGLNITLNKAVSRSTNTPLAPITYIDQTLLTKILSNSN